MTNAPVYTATCRRIGDWWAISVPEVKGVHSQAKRLDQVDAMARDAIAVMLDIDPASFHVRVEPDVPVEVAEAVQARTALREAEARAEEATRRAAVALLRQGYSVRDAGRVLGVSHQRVSQIARTDEGRKRRPSEAA